MKGKRATYGISFLFLTVGLVAAWLNKRNGDLDMGYRRDLSHELPYQRVAHKRLGQEIAKRHPAAKILLIKFKPVPLDNGEPCRTDSAQMEGLREGLNGMATIETVIEVSSGMEEGLSGENDASERPSDQQNEETLTAKKLDGLINGHKTCTVILSLAGLPPDCQRMKLWNEKDPKKRPALVLANAYLYDLKFAFKEEFISAALAHRVVPFEPNIPMPENEEEAFHLRFLIVTPDNVDQIDRENPDFFKPEKE